MFFYNLVFAQNPQDSIDLSKFTPDSKSIKKLYVYYGIFSGFDKKFSYEIANRFLELTDLVELDDTLLIQRELIKGDINLEKSNYPLAINHYKKAFLKAKDLRYPKAAIVCVNSIGTLYSTQRKSQFALRYYREGIEIAKHAKDTSALIILYGNIVSAYYQLLDIDRRFLDTSLIYNDSLLHLAEMNRGQGYEIQIANAYSRTGLLLTDAEKFKEAKFYLDKALQYFNQHNVYYQVAYIRYYLGRLFNAEKKFEKAVTELQTARMLAIETEDFPLAVDCNYELAQSYVGLKKFHFAVKNYEDFITANDTLINLETANSISQLSALYESEKKQNEIFLLSVKNKNQKNIIVIVCLALGIITFILFALMRMYSQKNRLNKELQQSYAEITKQKNELQLQKNIIENKNQEITDSIQYAGRIQKSLLTSDAYIKKYVDQFFILYRPKDIVSGDFYWAYYSEPFLYFVVADCTGHGVPGAFMSVLNISILNEIIVENGVENPAQIFNKAREQVIKSLESGNDLEKQKDGMDAVIAKINLKTLEAEFAAANNPIWIISKTTNQIIEITPDKMPIGYFIDNPPDFSLHKIKLEKGDKLIMLTDGFPDQFGGKRMKKFKHKRLQEVLLAANNLNFTDLKNHLEEVFLSWKRNFEQIDDVLVVGLQI